MIAVGYDMFFFFSSRRRHTRCSRDWSSDVCSSDLIRKIIRAWSRSPPPALRRLSTTFSQARIKRAPDSSFCSMRSEEHTSELQSRLHLVCRLLLEKKKTNVTRMDSTHVVHDTCVQH